MLHALIDLLKKKQMCANLKQVLSWEIKKIDLLKLWIYNLWFVCYRKSWHLCMRCWACLRTPWFSMMSWMLCSRSTSSSLLQEVCITFVLHITHQVLHTVNKLLFCARNFCEVGKSLIVVNISHNKQIFDKYMYLFVARNIQYFFPKIVS